MNKITMLYDNTNFDAYWDMAIEELQYINDDFDDDAFEDSEILDMAYWLMDTDWDDVHYQLKKFFEDKECIIFGTLGRWESNYNVWDTGTIDKCLDKALADCDLVQIYDTFGHLYVVGCHHDGTNIFEIKILKESGREYLDRWNWCDDDRTNADVCKQLVKRYTLCPHFAKEWFL